MEPAIAPIPCDEVLRHLLAGCGLPVADLAEPMERSFFGVHDADRLVAAVGLEWHGRSAQLRSLAVDPGWRRHGFARRLVGHAENAARERGLGTLHLLTTTAAGFFTALGWSEAGRATAPEGIRASAQFRGLCPSTATFMARNLSGG
ncbi:MAG: arsenic resistance N-acetyltransferase ArsN2 [Planctomycetes bacterium]|nr:arsenic resistance N-acetyltransferase ArsN2 [Planctomycetota bacterium]